MRQVKGTGLGATAAPSAPTHESADAIRADAGQLRFALRVGVTGHRRLPADEVLVPAVRRALQEIEQILPPFALRQVALVAVSPLAEGADRLVTREILARPGTRLEAILPLPPTEYARDSSDPASRTEFRQLLRQAAVVRQAPALPSRDQAYEWAGRQVVDRCDVLIAIWDGHASRGRGGTAEIVAYARKGAVPIAWVHLDGTVTTERFDGERAGALIDAVRELAGFNEFIVSDHASRAEQVSGRDYFGSADVPAGPLAAACEALAGWAGPYFDRADRRAILVQARFQRLSTAMFVMAASAVTVVAIQASFWPNLSWIAGVEVVLLAALLAIPVMRRRYRLQESWTSCRFLAERLRSAYFLALAGTTDRAGQASPVVSFADPAVSWIEHAMSEVAAARPSVNIESIDVVTLRQYLSTCWIGGQIRYFSRRAAEHDKLDDRLRRLTATLFAITFVCAILHMLGVGHTDSHTSRLGDLLIVLSISVPAIGTAMHGIETQRQYRRHARRFARMRRLLEDLQAEMEAAAGVARIRETAADVERILREESNDWFGVMRLHDIELIT